MTFNGLPLHPLVVHLTVVALPALALLAILSLHPRLRDVLRWPVLVLAVASFALVWFTAQTGESLRDHFVHDLHVPLSTYNAHADAADRLKLTTFAFAGLSVLRFLLDRRGGWIRGTLAVLVVIGACALGYFVYRTGETGAHLVYG